MASKGVLTKLELNIPGFNAVRRSAGVKGKIASMADNIVASAGPDEYEVKEWNTPQRSGVTIKPVSDEASLAEQRDKKLTRAIDAGRG